MKLDDLGVRYIIRRMNAKISGYQIAKELNISPERVYQIYRNYKKTGEIPILKQVGRPRKQLTGSEINLIITSFSRYKLSASLLKEVIKCESGININHNKIHKILLENHMAKKEPKKSQRRKPWVRYERHRGSDMKGTIV
jgi:transposase